MRGSTSCRSRCPVRGIRGPCAGISASTSTMRTVSSVTPAASRTSWLIFMGAELRAAHRAEVRHLGGILRQRLVVELLRAFRVEAEVELVFPAELEARLGERVVANLRAGVALGQVCGVGSHLVGDDAVAHVFLVGQAEVLFRCHVAQHGAAVPADHRRADGGGDVVVTRCDVRGQRAEGVERRLVAAFELLVHVLLDELHGHVARALDHGLHIVLPGDLREFAQRLEFRELGGIVGIGNGAGTQPVAQGEGHVVGLHDFADILEVLVEKALPVVSQAPLGHDRTAAADDAGGAPGGERHVAEQHAGVDREVVHPLLGLLDERVAVQLPGQFLGDTADFLERLVDGHGTDRNGGVAHDPLTGFVDVLACGKVHHGIGAPAGGPHHLLDLFLDARGHRRVADVCIHLHQEVAPDDHGLGFRVVDVVRDDGASRRHFLAHELRGDLPWRECAEILAGMLFVVVLRIGPRQVFANGDVLHLRGDDTGPGIVQLGDVSAGQGAPGRSQVGETQLLQPFVGVSRQGIGGTECPERLGVVPLENPGIAQAWDARRGHPPRSPGRCRARRCRRRADAGWVSVVVRLASPDACIVVGESAISRMPTRMSPRPDTWILRDRGSGSSISASSWAASERMGCSDMGPPRLWTPAGDAPWRCSVGGLFPTPALTGSGSTGSLCVSAVRHPDKAR